MAVFCTGATLPEIAKKASDFAVGESVFLNVNGTSTEFLVVQQGLPSSMYDASCDGMWLLMKDLYSMAEWDSIDYNAYDTSDINSYLNGDFLNLLDAEMQSNIKQVKIPHVHGKGSTNAVYSGSNGLSAKVFLLSAYEVGFSSDVSDYFPEDGVKLSYFDHGVTNAAETKRIAYYEGNVQPWWLRSPSTGDSYDACYVRNDGGHLSGLATNTFGIRPCLILPSTAKFDPDTNTFKGVI